MTPELTCAHSREKKIMKTHGKQPSWQGANHGFKIVISAYVQIYEVLWPKKNNHWSERMTQFLCQKQIGDFTGQGRRSSKNKTD